MIGLSVGIPAASLCINRRLYIIASVKSVTVSKAEKRRAILVDLAIGLGIPLLQMILRMLTYVAPSHDSDLYMQSTLSKDIVSTSLRTSDAFL